LVGAFERDRVQDGHGVGGDRAAVDADESVAVPVAGVDPDVLRVVRVELAAAPPSMK